MNDNNNNQESPETNNKLYPELKGSADVESEKVMDLPEVAPDAATEVADLGAVTEAKMYGDSQANLDQEPPVVTEAPKVKKHAGWWVSGAVLFVFLALAFGVWSGYTRGVNRRLNAQKDNLLTVAAQQLTLAYDDLENNQLDTARQRIEYILKIYPDFPGAQDMLVDIQMKMGLPTQAPPNQALPPTETAIGPTPTPDIRGAEELFTSAKTLVSEQKWAEALVAITSLREKYYDYKTAAVDGFYYVSLRNDGIIKIYNGKLEQGIWELSEAAQIGALDNQAAGAITVANMYVTGASYWDNNWPEAIRIFNELRQAYPNLTDATGMSTTERYRIALYKQGALFAAQNDFCSALNYYQQSLAVGPDQQISAQATIADAECNKPAPTEIVTPTVVTPDVVETQAPVDVPTATTEPPVDTPIPPVDTPAP